MMVLRSEIARRILLLALLPSRGQSFLAPPTRASPFGSTSFTSSSLSFCRASGYVRQSRIHLSSTQLPEIETMRAGQIKQELESYGISTKSFLEKSELVDALQQARAQGMKPKSAASTSSSSESSSSTSTSSSASTGSTASTASSESTKSREDRLAEEMARCQSMKASELKKELKERGISTAALFEKSEFVRAVAQARVDNVSRRSSAAAAAADSEGYAEYKNVEVLTDDAAGPRNKNTQQQASTNPFEGGAGSPFRGGVGSPFGGASGNPFGGVGGMGNIADMLKNMGVGGMGGASPFGGAGGANPFGGGVGANPFGGGAGMKDVMGKAQEMMKNPKVQELMRKAQSNPRIMAKVNECMSNPASFAKYQNDPDVAELITELRKYM